MIAIIKLASISAVLSAGVVTAYEAPKAVTAASAKVYQDRVAPEPGRLALLADASSRVRAVNMASDVGSSAGSIDCSAQAWPYLSRDCMAAGGAAGRQVVRTITIEHRHAPNTSTLVRLPTGAVASR